MSQAPPNVIPQNNSLYVLLGVVGGLCAVCGGFAVAIMACVSSLAPLSVSARPIRTDVDPSGGPTALENDRIAAARVVAEGFLDDLRRRKFEDAYHKIGGNLQRQFSDAKALGEIVLDWPRKIDKITLDKAGGSIDQPKFSGRIEGAAKKMAIALTLKLESGEYRVIVFDMEP
jgi:hypothetical protein